MDKIDLTRAFSEAEIVALMAASWVLMVVEPLKVEILGIQIMVLGSTVCRNTMGLME